MFSLIFDLRSLSSQTACSEWPGVLENLNNFNKWQHYQLHILKLFCRWHVDIDILFCLTLRISSVYQRFPPSVSSVTSPLNRSANRESLYPIISDMVVPPHNLSLLFAIILASIIIWSSQPGGVKWLTRASRRWPYLVPAIYLSLYLYICTSILLYSVTILFLRLFLAALAPTSPKIIVRDGMRSWYYLFNAGISVFHTVFFIALGSQRHIVNILWILWHLPI